MFFKTWGSFNNNEGVCLMILGNSLGGEGGGVFCSRKKRRAGRGVYMYMQYNCVCGGGDGLFHISQNLFLSTFWRLDVR